MKNYNYKTLAKYYDLLELEEYTPKYQNEFLSKFFKENNVRSILDITCGTGAQTIFLKQEGFDITGNDLSEDMLSIAKNKAQKENLKIHFTNMDIRTGNFNKYDAIISQCNSIGHLTEKDFNKALKNIANSLTDNGYFIFDISNYNKCCLENMSKEFIDICIKKDNYKVVRILKNRFNKKKQIINLKQQILIQEDKELKKFKNTWDLKVYSSIQLKKILNNNGFKILNLFNRHGCEFNDKKSWFILVIAQKNPQ
ncbi:class I SAM-dependent methyltransferase [Bacteroidota bacterium]